MENVKKKALKWMMDRAAEKGWNYRNMSEKLEVNSSTVIRWYNGTQFPRPVKFKKIMDTIEVNATQMEVFKQASLGVKLFLLRYSVGLDINEVSQAIIYNKELIRKWEKDIKKPNSNQIRRIMKYYDVSAEDLSVDVIPETFGSRLQEERESLGLTQSELGEQIGRKGSIISNFENDRTVPPVEDLEKIVDILNIPVEMLILEEDGLPSLEFAQYYIELQRQKQALCK